MSTDTGKLNPGIEYQFLMITYAAACLSENEDVADFEIYTNQDNVPGFDDIIIEVTYKSEPKPFVYLGQIKHLTTKKISFEGKLSTLEDYLQCIVEIRNNKAENHFLKNLLHDVPCENIEFWYISNSFLQNPEKHLLVLKDGKQCFLQEDTTHKSIFPHIKPASCYKLRTEEDHHYSNVVDKLRFFLNQPNRKRIVYSIAALNSDIFSIKIVISIIDYVERYLKISKKTKLTKRVFETEILRLSLSSFVVLPSIAFNIDPRNADIWNELSLQYDVTIIDSTLTDMRPYIFGCLWRKLMVLYQCVFDWNEFISNFKNADKIINYEKFKKLTETTESRQWLFVPDTFEVFLIEMWKSNYLPLVLSSETKSCILNKYKHLNKSFVILDHDQKIHNEVYGLQLRVLSDAADICESKLRNEFLKRIFMSLQGREPIDLFSLVSDNINTLKELQCDHILHLMRETRIFLKTQALSETTSMIFIIIDDLNTENAVDINTIKVADNENIIIKCKLSEVEAYTKQIKNNSKMKKYLIYILQVNEKGLELMKGEKDNLRQFFVDEDKNDLYLKNDKVIPIIGKSLKAKANYISRYLVKPVIRTSFFDSRRKVIWFLSGDLFSANWPLNNKIIQGSVDYVTSRIEIKLARNENAIVAIQNHNFEELWSTFSAKDYPLLHVKVEEGSLVLLKYKNCQNISSYIVFEGPKIDERSFFKEIPIGITVISGEPGIGKSSLLRYLFNICDKSNYVLFCDLNDYRQYLRERNKELFDNPLDFMIKKETELANYNNRYTMNFKLLDFLCKILERTGKITLFLDSFDDILPICQEEVLDFIRIINKYNIRLIIASRLIMTHILITAFEVQPIMIEPLNYRNAMSYIDNEDLTKIEFNRYPQEFRENPMYLNFLITLHREKSLLPTTITRSTLYNAIIEKHVERYYIEKANFYASLQYRYILRKDVLNVHKLLALVAVFGEEVINSLGLIYNQLRDECICTDKFKLGLIIRFNDNCPIFVHRTFAEYLVAEWISENFNVAYVRRIYEMLFETNELHIRHLLDDILCENLTLHQAVLSEDPALVENLCSVGSKFLKEVDKLNRTALHIASTYCSRHRAGKKNYLILETILHHMNDKKIDVNGCDSLMKWTWIQYLNFNIKFFRTACMLGLTVTLGMYLNYKNTIDDGIVLTIKYGNLDTTLELFKRDTSVLVKYFNIFVVKTAALGYLNLLCDMFELQNYNNRKFNILCKACKNLSLVSTVSDCTNLTIHGGFTALHIACIYRHVGVVRKLLNLGVEVNVVDNFKHKPLYYGIIQSSAEIVSILMEHTSKLNNNTAKLFSVSTASNSSSLDTYDISGICKTSYQPYLHVSVKRNYTDIVKILLENNFDINERNKNGETALAVAVKEERRNISTKPQYNKSTISQNNAKKIEIIKVLLEYQADCNVPDNFGNTPLQIATKYNCLDIVEILLQHNVRINFKNEDVDTALCIATRDSNAEIVKLLLEYGGNSVRVDNNNNPLFIASENGDGYIIKMLLKYKPTNEFEINTALHIAAGHGNVVAVKILLEHGANINFKDKYGDTVLHVTTRNGRTDIDDDANHFIEIITILLEGSVDINHKGKDNKTALHIAIKNGNLRIAKMLLENDANLNLYNKYGQTALHVATINNHLEIVKVLLESGANVNDQNEAGNTALQIAIRNKNIKLVDVFLKNAANVDIKNNIGNSALITAIRKKHDRIVMMLLQKGADVNLRNIFGNTPLHAAVRNKRANIVKILLDNGADVNITNDQGQSAFGVAYRFKNKSVMKLLFRHGKDSSL